jgi:hypothetical protein
MPAFGRWRCVLCWLGEVVEGRHGAPEDPPRPLSYADVNDDDGEPE